MEEDTRHFNDLHKSAHPQEGVCLYPPAMFDCSKSASLNHVRVIKNIVLSDNLNLIVGNGFQIIQ